MVIGITSGNWTLQPPASRQAEAGLRETCASKHPRPGNFWLSVSPFCKPTPSFPALCHPHTGADISLPLSFPWHGPRGNITLRAATLERAAGDSRRDAGHSSILGMFSSAPTETTARGLHRLQRTQGGCRTCGLPL